LGNSTPALDSLSQEVNLRKLEAGTSGGVESGSGSDSSSTSSSTTASTDSPHKKPGLSHANLLRANTAITVMRYLHPSQYKAMKPEGKRAMQAVDNFWKDSKGD
jgi:hypothetical protein